VLQARLLPRTGTSELAEVLVAGLLERASAPTGGIESEHFRFRPMVGELLRRGTTTMQQWDTFEAISDYLEENAGIGDAVHALLADPGGIAAVDATLEPFAAFGRSVAARLGLRLGNGLDVGAAGVVGTRGLLALRRAVDSDFAAIIDLNEEASRWLRTKDTDQWAQPWPNRRQRDQRIMAAIRAGRTWIAWDGDQPAATITASPADNGIWPEESRDEPAVYVSRLVVSRRYAGRALGAQLLDWAGLRASSEYGARWIRVDVWTTNTRLHGYLRGLGFSFHGFSEMISGYPSAALFQKPTGQIRPPERPPYYEPSPSDTFKRENDPVTEQVDLLAPPPGRPPAKTESNEALQPLTEDHHGSHRDLLWTPDDPATLTAQVDAIIVPTIRRPAALRHAAEISISLDCALITLHSGRWTSAREAARQIPPETRLIAIDVSAHAGSRLPELETSRLLANTRFARRSDLSLKRNLGLTLCHMVGWDRIIFLDDDITVVDAADLSRAMGLLDTHNAVGFTVSGFPDYSVVSHAYLMAGGSQQSFISGRALAVHVTRSSSFFPDIYHDDWFYVLDDARGLQPVAVTGRVIQAPYDPFRNPDRARAEELGEVLAEGALWLLDQNRPLMDADLRYWGDFLQRRQRFIMHVMSLVERANIEAGEKVRMVTALKASAGRLARITPELCRDYLRAFATDREGWRDHIDHLPSDQSLGSALRLLLGPGRDQSDAVVRNG
jgi:ribosomal protein S18 acetylase RimI-like enzyme